MNDIILVSLIAMIVAQLLKLPINFVKNGNIDYRIIFSTGSMPSSHTAVVVAMTIESAIISGLNSNIFGVAFIFMAITIHDAVKVRGESGKQAFQINQLSKEFEKIATLLDFSKTQEYRHANLKELIGHTIMEVLGGILIGVLVIAIYNI